MNIEKLRKLAGREEVDYQLLLSALSDYAYPRDKISGLLKSGELIRVKKGLYIFGKEAALLPYSPDVLANLIYGPSAISLQYALSYYGLIPERVALITSITNKRNKAFTTPVGEFTYRYLTTEKYAVGIELITSNVKSPFLMASAEKALCDQVHLVDKKIKLITLADAEHYLLSDMRISEERLEKLRLKKLTEIVNVYKDKRLSVLYTFISEWKKHA